MRRQKIFRAAALSLLVLSAVALGAYHSAPPSAAGAAAASALAQLAPELQAKVDSSVLEKAALGRTEFLIYMGRKADLSGADALSTKEEKGQYVYEKLTATAEASQSGVRQTLAEFGAEYRSFWVSNAVWAKGDLTVVKAIAAHPEVAYIYASGGGALKLPPQEAATASADAVTAETATASASFPNNDPNPEPGLLKVNADDVWAMGVQGRGAVVASADTGVNWDHAALKRQYRGWDDAAGVADHNYNWHDGTRTPCEPGTETSNAAPCDDDSHGTHTVGTMVGDDGASNRVGMAPEAEWVACRNMAQGVGVVPTYLDCMQWFIAPTDLGGQNPRPAKAPHVINNSWGCVEGCPPPALQDTLRASRAAGIFYAVSAGNDGQSPLGAARTGVVICSSLNFPLARYPESFTVGSTDIGTDTISYFSSRGPVLGDPTAPAGLMKPNITAPGAGIRSSVPGGGYGNKSGTSMAGPHVAGMVALLVSANPRLAGMVDRLEDIIEGTAVRKTTTEGCGLDSVTAVPNNTYGWGRIDALAAVLDALPPTAANDTATTTERTAVNVNVLANDTDPDGDTLTVTSVGPASNGTVVRNADGTLTYVPATGFVGVDTFVYTICAPEGCLTSSSTAAVTVTVNKLRGGKKK
ncbi:MAG TPA: S8 family serine peptidase [Pyrinomonadaceae bacterium]|nr:S8 family serine peptidase [Pyrinomonadaceae bacterium]